MEPEAIVAILRVAVAELEAAAEAKVAVMRLAVEELEAAVEAEA